MGVAIRQAVDFAHVIDRPNAPVCIEERVTTSPHLRTGQTRSAEDARVDVLSAVLARAETDVAFRARLLTEPHRAIEDAFGIQVPQDFRLRFIERQSDIDALVVLPDLRPADGEPADLRS